MRKLIFLFSVMICTVSYGQNRINQIGINQVNELTFCDGIMSGFGAYFTNGEHYIGLSTKIYTITCPKVAFNRIQLNYRSYLFNQKGVFKPYVALNAEFMRDSDEYSYWQSNYSSNYNSSSTHNEQYTRIDHESKEMNSTLGIGIGTDIRINDKFHVSVTASARTYRNSRKVTRTVYQQDEATTSIDKYRRSGFDPSFRVELGYTLASFGNKAKKNESLEPQKPKF